MDDREFYAFLIVLLVIALVVIGIIGIPRVIDYMSIPVFHGEF
jgi:hypothetical protein